MCAKPLDPRLRKAVPQVQIRPVGPRREEVEAALALLQTTACLQIQRGPHRGRKDEWLVYATLELPVLTPTLPATNGETQR